jgi:hypothetical protein
MTADDDARRAKVRVLSAIEAAAEDPIRLVRAVLDATDDEDAVRRVGAAFGLDDDLARVLLDLQFRGLSRSSRARRVAELGLLRAAWGPPVEATLTVSGRRRGVLSVDGAEHQFMATGRQDLLLQVHAFLHEQIARPRLRPVVLVDADAADGRLFWTVQPDGSGSAEDVGD